ncbi:acetamidase [Marinicauda salina]|uniref:Acetamidase n=1 Tax=Marinicauda salina TaxID=2135793 RepID=A0A2U2BX34_9PROT|nr:acetamidase/formamidase family protein [Marinicauda salina]PWE18581.1 acetamidase [Marinicauda salina]
MGHTLHDHRHCDWDRDRAPALVVAPGEAVSLATLDASGGQLGPDSAPADVAAMDQDKVNPVNGPIAIDGAEPGDAIAVTLTDLETDGWGWTANIPGFGLLAGDFPHPVFWRWTIDRARGRGEAPGGIGWAPVKPFMGTIGLAPGAPGPHGIIPPYRTGGNMDCRKLVSGARLILPVEAAGGLVSAGDGHAAQGDGEVCGTAIETGMRLSVELELMKAAAPRAPVIETPAEAGPAAAEPRLVTTGVGPDLMDASRTAVRQMIDELTARRGLSAEAAYLMCSVCGDLSIAEIVDAPNWTVAFAFPLGRLG